MAAVLRVGKLTVMTSTITRSPLACRPTRLVRRVGGVELPAAVMGNVRGSHADIAFAFPRRLRRTERWRGRVVEATIVVAEDPDGLLVGVLLETGLAA